MEESLAAKGDDESELTVGRNGHTSDKPAVCSFTKLFVLSTAISSYHRLREKEVLLRVKKVKMRVTLKGNW